MTHHYVVFLWKSLKERQRHPVRNLFNTFIPILFTALFVFGRPLRDANYNEENLADTVDELNLADYLPSDLSSKIYYAPKSEVAEALIENVRLQLQIVYERVEAFDSEQDLERALHSYNDLCYGIVFANRTNGLHYTIRTKNNNFRTETVHSRGIFESYLKKYNEYIVSGFLTLQHALDVAYIERQAGLSEDALPHSRYGHIPLTMQLPREESSIRTIAIIMCVFASVFLTYLMLIPLMEEKSTGMREYLKIATPFSYWNEGAICSVNFLHLFAVLVACVIVAISGDIFTAGPTQIVMFFVLVVLFCVNTIVYTFFISSLVESVTIATAIAPISYFLPLLYGENQATVAHWLLIFPLNGFLYGVNILHNFQNSGHIYGVGNVFSSDHPGTGQWCMFVVWIFTILGILWWALVYFYISNVFPGRYGIPRSKMFLFQKNFYTRTKANRVTHRRVSEEHDVSSTMHNSEQTVEKASHLRKVVQIYQLNKVFKMSRGTRTAVKNFSMKIYRNQITVLLGHNGAGKTTMMNIMVGMLPQTSGWIEVDGDADPATYRSKIGFCPQHNVAFPFLNCREHLEIMGTLRGIPQADIKKWTNSILEKVNLIDKAEVTIDKLSGGMKRRLCLANAIIGETKLLILDEPTSGLDPESRRDIWDILLKLRKDHTILITTHFMEEADILGDWIAIMELGELVAFGSSLFLKHHYGKGYTLKLVTREGFDEQEVINLVRNYVQDAFVRPTIAPLFAVTLPYRNVSDFAPMLCQLEDEMDRLRIESVSINNATLEEVFLNSSSQNKALEHEQISFDCVDGSAQSSPTSQTLHKQWPSKYLMTFWAIFYKKRTHVKRNLHIYLSLSMLPICAVILCHLLKSSYSPSNFQRVRLHPSSIKQSVVMIVLNDYDRLPITVEQLQRSTAFRGTDVLLYENRVLEEELKILSRRNPIEYHDRLVAAIELNITEHSMKILHNNNLVHSTGIAETLAANLLLQYYGILDEEVTVQNMPSTRKQSSDLFTPYLLTEMIAFTFMLYMLQYLQLPLLERTSGIRSLENTYRFLYWGSTFMLDYCVHFLVSSLVVWIAYIFGRGEIFAASAYSQILGILLLYGLSTLVVVYIISQCVDSMDTAVTIMSYLMTLGIGGVVLLSDGYDKIQSNSGLIFLFHIIPDFQLKHSLRVVYENQKLVVAESFEQQYSKPISTMLANKPLQLDYIYVWAPATFMALVFILGTVVENMYTRDKINTRKAKGQKLLSRLKRSRDQVDHNGDLNRVPSPDGDVDAESRTVNDIVDGSQQSTYALVMHNVQKIYIENRGVEKLNIAVRPGECFGLLGMNGAGKTTTFNMITRNLPLTDGKIYLHDFEVRESREMDYRAQYGYCPQNDSLLDFMTVYELINYFAMTKNLAKREDIINRWLRDLDIMSFAHSCIRDCSGGTKRKINTILAMLGTPHVILLDEPTTGVDPKSRYFVWERIKNLQRRDQAIILTSHSMDECEELCSRLSIMVDGQLRCIGFIQRLKEKYGQGFSLTLKLQAIEAEDSKQQHEQLVQVVHQRLDCNLKESHENMLKFIVPKEIKLSTLFEEGNKLILEFPTKVVSFSVNESSLEDIFLNFRPTSNVC